jgi:hypothetical protein
MVDLDGRIPTPAEAARMAAHVYGDKKNGILIGGWKVSNRDFGIKLQDATYPSHQPHISEFSMIPELCPKR